MRHFRKAQVDLLPTIAKPDKINLRFREVKDGIWDAELDGYWYVARGDEDGYEAAVLNSDGKILEHSRERRRTRGAMGARGKWLSEDAGTPYKTLKAATNWLNKQALRNVQQTIRRRNERLFEEWRKHNDIPAYEADRLMMDFEEYLDSEYNPARGIGQTRPRSHIYVRL